MKMNMNSFNGVLESKYKDSLNHNYPILLIRNNQKENQINLINEMNDVFEKVETGDMLEKQKGSLKLFVERGDKKLVYYLDYGCVN